MAEISEEKLIKGCVKGDSLYQKTFFEKYSPRVMGIAMRYTKSPDEAHDILQETFIKAFNNLKSYKNTGPIEGWLRKICVNTALDYIRKNKQKGFIEDIDDVDYKLPIMSGNILDEMAAEDIINILNTLPLGYKTVFNMFVIDGYSHKEIAEQLEISVSTSKSQFSRARAILKEKVKVLL